MENVWSVCQWFSHHFQQIFNLRLWNLLPVFKCDFFVQGYAIEYDYFPPTQLRHT
jgi:tRNA U34 5-carboxymethylaminomethyl modifying enzyme MnmG/GidA